MKPFSEACERNREPILGILRRVFADRASVLEIGSGTGQHAAHFAASLPHLFWTTSDLPVNHEGIRAWLAEADLPNVTGPLALDVMSDDWPHGRYDAVFSANTAHIMSREAVAHMFAGVGRLLPPGGLFVLYGPFNYDGNYTSESNARFDEWLKARDPESGIRDIEWIVDIAAHNGLELVEDNAMPANNRLLVLRKA